MLFCIFLELQFPFPIKPRADSIFLAKFIRTKDNKTKPALKSIEKYYKNYIFRNLHIIKGINPSQFKEAYDAGILTILKDRHDGARVAIIKIANWMPRKLEVRYLLFATLQYLEFAVEQEIETQQNGIVLIYDLQGFKFEHLRALSVTEIKRTMTAVLVSNHSAYVILLNVMVLSFSVQQCIYVRFYVNSLRSFHRSSKL